MQTQEQKNIELVKSFIETFWNKKEMDAIDRFLSSDYMDHTYNPKNVEGLRFMATALHTASSDQSNTIEEIISQGDKVMVRLVMRGTNDGPFQGKAASGKSFEVVIFREYRIIADKITDHWALFDTFSFIRQITV